MTLDLSLGEPAGSRSLHRLVGQFYYFQFQLSKLLRRNGEDAQKRLRVALHHVKWSAVARCHAKIVHFKRLIFDGDLVTSGVSSGRLLMRDMNNTFGNLTPSIVIDI